MENGFSGLFVHPLLEVEMGDHCEKGEKDNMGSIFRLLFIGDVIGPVGCTAIQALVPELRRELQLDASRVGAG